MGQVDIGNRIENHRKHDNVIWRKVNLKNYENVTYIFSFQRLLTICVIVTS